MVATRKIGLFGGTFDPIHLGHIHLATLAKEALRLDEIRFIPCQISPHKPMTRPASAEDRCKMLSLATSGLQWAIVDPYEISQNGPSYSYQTAQVLTKRFPDAQLYWIMGSDQWQALPRWKNPEILAELCEFIVLNRGTAPQARDGYRMSQLTAEHPAAASIIRQAISDNLPLPAWIHPDVAAWIEQHQLYRGFFRNAKAP
jgi:nicotinate-nucleotide adenylyltransferase